MRLPLACLLVSLFSPLLARAVVPQDQVPARVLAAGRTRAFAQGLDALVLNPAGLGAVHRFQADVDYLHATGTDAADGGDGVSAWVGDSASNQSVALALGYRFLSAGSGALDVRGSIFDLGLSLQPVPQLLVGGRLSYLRYALGGRDVRQFTGDLGAMGLFGPVMVGLTGFNLIGVDAPEAARGLSLAAGYSDNRLYRVGADVRWEWLSGGPQVSASGGAEYLLGDAIPVRAGYEWDGVRNRSFVSGGAGYISPSWGFDLSARWDLDSGEVLLLAALKFFDT